MKLAGHPKKSFSSGTPHGFTLVEVMVGVGFLATSLVAIYLAFSSGFRFVQLTRENLRATQVLTEKLETIRLYTWDQVNTTGFIPTTFTASFTPPAGTNTNIGVIYSGTMAISPAPISQSYSNDLRLVEVEIIWMSGNNERRRSMKTLVSQYGIQNYRPN